MTSQESRRLGVLRATALIAALLGGVCSVGLMHYVGRRNESHLLLVLFGLWVLSPFVVLGLTTAISKSWSTLTQTALYSATLVLTLVSLAIYGRVASGPPRGAFAFVATPPISWLLIAVVVAVAARISDKRSR